jgi:hypothetical protein
MTHIFSRMDQAIKILVWARSVRLVASHESMGFEIS